MRLILTLVSILALSGCTLFAPAADKIADGVNEYCGRVSQAERQLVRDSVNQQLAEDGHSVRVDCAGDG